MCIIKDLIGRCTRGDFLFFFQLRPGLSEKGFHVNKLSSEFWKNLLGFYLFFFKTNNCFEQRIKLLVHYLLLHFSEIFKFEAENQRIPDFQIFFCPSKKRNSASIWVLTTKFEKFEILKFFEI